MRLLIFLRIPDPLYLLLELETGLMASQLSSPPLQLNLSVIAQFGRTDSPQLVSDAEDPKVQLYQACLLW